MTTREVRRLPDATAAKRLAWPDELRAVAIVLVVFLHVCNKHFTVVDWPAAAHYQHRWTTFNEIVWPLLMPAFYLVAGFFASRAIEGPWRAYRVRAARPYYLYVVWLAIFGLFFWAGPTIENARFGSVGVFLSNLVYPQQALWFLYGLALFYVLAKPLRRWPVIAVLLASALAIKAPTLLAGDGHWPDIAENLVYFLIGAFAPGFVRAVAARIGVRDLVLSAITFTAVTIYWRTSSPDFIFGASFAAIWFAMNAAAFASREPRTGALLGMIGRRTLAIYVIHLPLVAIVNYAFVHWIAGHVADAGWLALPYPVVVTAAVVAASLGVETLLRRAGAGWLFELPSWLRRWLSGRPATS